MTKTNQQSITESVKFGIILATVGGFLDAYTFITRGGVFANAQTGNIVMLSMKLASGKFSYAFMYLLPILAFINGVIIVEYIKKCSIRFAELKWQYIILTIEIVILIIVGFIPKRVPDMYVNIIISFVASMQTSSFRKLVDSPYATTMSTGNLRSATQFIYTAFSEKNDKAMIKAKRYITIIIAFCIGGFIGAIATKIIGIKSVWISAMILLAGFVLLCIGDAQKQDEVYGEKVKNI